MTETPTKIVVDLSKPKGHRQAGIDALVQLGLTEEQITALVGA